MIERRRMMFAAGGGEVDPWIVYLKSIGCKSYFPLTEGDFTDKIGHQTLQFSGNGSAVWDATEDMYLMTTPSQANSYIASASYNCINEFSVVATVKVLSRSSSNPADIVLLTSASDGTMMTLNSAGQTWARFWPSIKVVNASCFNYSSYSVYEDGVDVKDNTTSTWFRPIFSQNTFHIGHTKTEDQHSKYFGRQFYIKDLMIFDRKLTLAQVSEITSHLKESGDYNG